MESKTNPQHEPTAVRGCTDVFWLILYILFWVFMVRSFLLDDIIAICHAFVCFAFALRPHSSLSQFFHLSTEIHFDLSTATTRSATLAAFGTTNDTQTLNCPD